MPGNVAGTEWAAYYVDFAAAFGLTIDSIGPDFGIEPLLDTIADSSTLATFVSEQTPLVWPAGHDLRRIPLRDPVPVYPHSLLWRTDNPNKALTALRDHFAPRQHDNTETETWTPQWAQHSKPSPSSS